MESFYGRELRVKKTMLLGMWYSGLGFIGGTAYMFYVASDWRRLIRSFGSVFVAAVALFFLWGVHALAKALKWTFARVTMDDMGITLKTLSGSEHADWMGVESLDFLDKEGAISIISRSGEKLNLTIGLEEFPDVLRAILEKLRTTAISTVFSNQFATRRFSGITTLIGLGGVVIVVLTSLFVLHDEIGLWVAGVGFIGLLVFQVASGLRWVTIEDNMIRIKYVWHTREVPIDDVTGISMSVKNIGKKEQASLVVALDLVTSKKPVEIPFRGPNLLPFYLRLKQVVPHREP
jgi:hypothetical protein